MELLEFFENDFDNFEYFDGFDDFSNFHLSDDFDNFHDFAHNIKNGLEKTDGIF